MLNILGPEFFFFGGQAILQTDVRFAECLQLLQLAGSVRQQLEPFVADALTSPWVLCLSPPTTPGGGERGGGGEGVEGAGSVSVLSELAELCLVYGKTAQMVALLRRIDMAEVTAAGRWRDTCEAIVGNYF